MAFVTLSKDHLGHSSSICSITRECSAALASPPRSRDLRRMKSTMAFLPQKTDFYDLGRQAAPYSASSDSIEGIPALPFLYRRHKSGIEPISKGNSNRGMFAWPGACGGRDTGPGWGAVVTSSSPIEDDDWGDTALRHGAVLGVGARPGARPGALGRLRFGSSSRYTIVLRPGLIVTVYEALESSSILFSSL